MKRWSRAPLITFAWALIGARLVAAQTAVVLNPDGGTQVATQQVTIQSDGGSNTFIFSQGIAAGAPVPPPQGGGVFLGGVGPLPPRDQQSSPDTGSSRIRGRVIAADSGRPIRRAVVRVASAAIRESRATATDQDGQFDFAQLPAGQYTVSASKSGFVQTGYRQTRPNGPPRPLTLGDREVADHVDISLIPGGVITGRVVDEYGEPVSDVLVAAQRLQYSNGARRPVPSGPPSTSNDIGEFRIYGLAPGEFYVLATPRNAGGPLDVTNDRTGYAPTYYPATPDPSAAQRVTVRAGDAVSNLVISLTVTRTARISGTVLDAEGRPARGGNVSVAPRTGGIFPSANGMVRPDGSFVVSGVAPGEYTLRAFINQQSGGPISPSMAEVIVNGSDLSNVILQPQTPITVSGRLTGDPATLSQIRPASARLSIVSLGGAVFAPGPPAPPPALRDDLSFQVPAYPGTVAVRPMSLPGLLIKSVRMNGRDVTRGFEIEPGVPVSDLEVEVTAATARLTVTVTNGRGEAAADQDVVVFPQDESEWGAQMPGHGGSGRTDETGQFQSTALLPGAYYVAISDSLQPGDSNDPEILGSLRTRAQRITVGESDAAAVQLRTSDR
jgi:hypothetical protein